MKKFFNLFMIMIVSCMVLVVPSGCFNDISGLYSDLEIHFLELGNKYAGDCIFIKAGDVDVLVDAGSRSNSLDTIVSYIDDYVTDGIIEYAIITHAHQDHYACYATSKWENSMFAKYDIENLITFSQSNNVGNVMYENYMSNLEIALSGEKETKVTNYYTADECMDKYNSFFNLTDDIYLEILDNKYYYELSSNENNNSVCFLLSQGDNHYLFTGDLESDAESYLVENNTLPKCVLYKAGHHGSYTATSEKLLNAIANKGENKLNVVVTCVAGANEYTQKVKNTFPSQDFIDRVAQYTDCVYVTSYADYGDTLEISPDGSTIIDGDEILDSMNGNIVYCSDGYDVNVYFSNNNLKLKDTEWMFEWRIMPKQWQ